MTIDTVHFTPLLSLAGGMLIGLAATLLLWAVGRIAGISGIARGVLFERGERAWRVLFLAGLLLGALLWRFSGGSLEAPHGYPLPLLALAGLLVGYGTALGSGCTSGHGICGIARLSPRSALATLVFVATGMAAVFVLRHLLGVVR
jgi:uncharacterized membrane protein YedE/YeeE